MFPQRRMTTDTPDGNYSQALNLFVRGEGGWVQMPSRSISLNDYMKQLIKAHNADIDTEGTPEEFDMTLYEHLFDGPETIEGLLAEHYTLSWALASLRDQLDTLLGRLSRAYEMQGFLFGGLASGAKWNGKTAPEPGDGYGRSVRAYHGSTLAPVCQIDRKTNQVIHEYPSIAAAACALTGGIPEKAKASTPAGAEPKRVQRKEIHKGTAYGVLRLRCPKCGDVFGRFLLEPSASVTCRCGGEVQLDNLTRYEFTCPCCDFEARGRTNLEDPEITVPCKCGNPVTMKWDRNKRMYHE